MPDTSRVYGNMGAASIGGVAYLISEWDYEEKAETEKAPAAGDVGTHRQFLRSDWQANIKGFIADETPLKLPIGTASTRLVGTASAVALKLKSTHANPVIADTGLVTSGEITSPASGPVTIAATVESSDGGAMPTFDATPGS